MSALPITSIIFVSFHFGAVVGSDRKTDPYITRGRAGVARHPHKVEVAGSNPARRNQIRLVIGIRVNLILSFPFVLFFVDKIYSSKYIYHLTRLRVGTFSIYF